jgi:hypothetical protein
VASKGKGKNARKSKRTVVSSRVVASAKVAPTREGLVELKLTSARAYQALVQSRDGLYATIGLRFTTRGEATLTSSVQATFHAAPAKPAKKASKTKSSKSAKQSENARAGEGR